MTNQILVLGNGFIGNGVHRVLSELGFDVSIVAARSDPDEVVRRAQLRPPAVVIHAAGQAQPRMTIDIYEQAIESARRNIDLVTRLSRSTGCAVFLVSSGGSVYDHRRTSPQPETQTTAPSTPYGMLKEAEEKLLGAQLTDGLSILRVSSVYGPQPAHGRSQGLLMAAINAERSGRALEISAHPQSVRDYLHIADLGHLVAELIVCRMKPRVINLGSGQVRSTTQTVRLLEDLFPSLTVRMKTTELAPSNGAPSTDLMRQLLSHKPAPPELGFPSTSLSLQTSPDR